jgi:endonuclease I
MYADLSGREKATMANTKSLSRDERKTAKRKDRKELKAVYATLTVEQQKKFRKREDRKVGVRAFVAKAGA